jgi:hypothetical protein
VSTHVCHQIVADGPGFGAAQFGPVRIDGVLRDKLTVAAIAEAARIVAVASDDKQNFRTLGMMSSLKGARLIGAM